MDVENRSEEGKTEGSGLMDCRGVWITARVLPRLAARGSVPLLFIYCLLIPAKFNTLYYSRKPYGQPCRVHTLHCTLTP